MRKIKYKNGKRLQPYTLEYTGSHKNKEVEMQLFVYDDCPVEEHKKGSIDFLSKRIDLAKTNWLNIHGLTNIDLLQEIARHFEIDNFMLADILNTTKRTKLEEEKD